MEMFSSLQDYVQGYVPEAKEYLDYIQQQAEGTVTSSNCACPRVPQTQIV